MKIINKIWILALGVTVLFSCTEILDTYPEGSTFTEEQKKEIVGMTPERLSADINGLYSMMGKQFPVYGEDNGRADDFGYPMVCLSNDLNGADMWSTDDNYNWFTGSSDYTDRTYTYANPYQRWANFYNQIKSANDILASIPEDTENETLLHYKGQALAVRAFDYFSLVQQFQFTYKGNEDKPGVPIVTFGMTDPKNPRARVDSIYMLIMDDLNTAIPLLEGFVRPNKAAVDQKVAYGIRARVNLVMQNYSDAASDAENAMAGYTFLSKESVSTPSFYNAVTSSSWMWGVIINPSNITDNLATITSKINSFTGYGYSTAVSCYKGINNLLWDLIPATDVRKGWWVDENLESPLLDGLEWDGYVGQEIGPGSPDGKGAYLPYTNVKFGVENGPGNTDNAEDWPIMRAEEMLLIKAEGKAMSGSLGEAKTILEDFVKTYRDSSYTCTVATPEEMQNEIWFQRRVELWGEGFAMSDIMRLKKNIVRFKSGVESSFPDIFKFNIASTDGYLLLRIPQREISSNTGISDADNNNEGTLPLSGVGAGLTDGVVVK